MWTSHMNLRLIQQVLLFSLVSLSSAGSSGLSGISGILKGKNSLKEAILARDERKISDIMHWKSCEILVENDNELLKLFVTTKQRKLLNNILEKYDYEKLESCIFKGAATALKHDDSMALEALLSIIKEFRDQYITGTVFDLCTNARNYQCIETMTDWNMPLCHKSMNILHYAADLDDMTLLKYAPKNQLLMEVRSDHGHFPMSLVVSKPMAEKFNERWIKETQIQAPKSWDAVQAMYYITKMFGLEDHTLTYRATFFANQLQQTVESPHIPRFELKVTRANFFEDSYKAVHKSLITEFDWYRSNLKPKIIFDSEEGIDAGGPRLEWLGLMIKAMFQPNPNGSAANFTAPLFKEVDSDSGMFAPTMEYYDTVYEFAGSILALAFREKISLKVNLIPAILKAILINGEYRYSPEDFQRQHPVIYKNMVKMYEMTAEDIEADDMYFMSNRTLKVTKNNLKKYIDDYGFYVCYAEYASAIKALAKGFKRINTVPLLHSIFSHQEMAAVLKGGTKIDVESFMKHSIVTGSEESQKDFWKMMEMLTDEERLKFFKYVTGRDSVPYEGITGLKDKLKIVLDIQPPGYLPAASTCFSKINFASDIKSAEEMKQRLLKAFDQSLEQFGLH